MKSKKYIVIGLFIVGILLSLYFLLWKESEPKLTEKVEVPKQTIKEITEVVEESKKIDEFILARIPNGDNAFFKREQFTGHNHGEDHADVTNELLREETMRFVYSSFMLQDVDQLTVAFSSGSIRSLQGSSETGNATDLIQRLTDFLALVNRDGKLDKLEYQFELDEYDKESNKGVLSLVYSDNQLVKVDIELESVGDEGHRAYEVITPLSEIESLFK